MRKIKAVATDIDGTLTDGRQLLTSQALKCIREVESMGICVILASGHHLCGMESLARYLGASGPLIAENGGVVKNVNSNKVYVLGDRSKVERAFSILKEEIKNLKFGRSTSAGYKQVEMEFERNVGIKEFQKILGGHEIEEVEVIDTGFAIHLKDASVDKGKGLRKAAEILGMDARNIAAVGDSQSDVAMFKVCGLSIALANAPEEVKRAANIVTSREYGEGFEEATEIVRNF